MKPANGYKEGVPRFSVALCTYNGARHINEQLESIAGQTRRPDQLVIRDDGSTDTTAEAVAAFAARAPFPVRFERQAVNLGVTQNFASALAACQGDLIALCDQDDVWLPDRLENFARFFDRQPHCLAVFSDAVVVDEALHPLPSDPGLWSRVGLTRRERDDLRDPVRGLATLAGRYLVTGATLVVRRELLSYALPIPHDLPDKVIHDGWIALVAAALGRLDSLPLATLKYRQHSQQQVGLRADPALPKGGVLARPRARYGQQADQIERIHALLTARIGPDAGGAALALLAGKVAFLRRRAAGSRGFWNRLRSVTGDLLQGSYHRFCRWSAAAALRDLLP